MSYVEEFQDFVLDVTLPEGCIDVSWHNDACPSFELPSGHILFVDYADRAQREFPEAYRFQVNDTDMQILFCSESWEETSAFVQSLKETPNE